MTGRLLWRGMLAGLVAGLLCFAFLKTFGEPPVDRAIAFEAQMDEAKAHAHHDHGQAEAGAGVPPAATEPDVELVSRSTQAGLGLFTGVVVYSAAVGGLFALAFALVYGRAGRLGPRQTAALLAAIGFVALYLVPSLKYPANPPAVGDPDTIGLRTGLYFSVLVLSLVAAIAATMLRRLVLARLGGWNATLVAAAYYAAIMIAAAALLPAINEVPATFPATTLWQFRVASLGAQAILWTALALLFGLAAERALTVRPGRLRSARQPAT